MSHSRQFGKNQSVRICARDGKTPSVDTKCKRGYKLKNKNREIQDHGK